MARVRRGIVCVTNIKFHTEVQHTACLDSKLARVLVSVSFNENHPGKNMYGGVPFSLCNVFSRGWIHPKASMVYVSANTLPPRTATQRHRPGKKQGQILSHIRRLFIGFKALNGLIIYLCKCGRPEILVNGSGALAKFIRPRKGFGQPRFDLFNTSLLFIHSANGISKCDCPKDKHKKPRTKP